MIYALVEVEDMLHMTVVEDDDGRTLTFETAEEAEEYGDRHCFDARVLEVEE